MHAGADDGLARLPAGRQAVRWFPGGSGDRTSRRDRPTHRDRPIRRRTYGRGRCLRIGGTNRRNWHYIIYCIQHCV